MQSEQDTPESEQDTPAKKRPAQFATVHAHEQPFIPVGAKVAEPKRSNKKVLF